MYLETDAIIIRVVKTLKGRVMVLLFTEKYGKISAGAFQRLSKKDSGSALRPFALGFYELRKNLGIFQISKSEIKDNFFSLGENLERFVNASFIMEFTEKLLPEEAPFPALFELLADFLRLISGRNRGFDTLVVAYMLKSMHIWGVTPELDVCSLCGAAQVSGYGFSVKQGGIVCNNCTTESENIDILLKDELIYMVDFDIVKVMKYLIQHPLKHFEGLVLDDSMAKKLRMIFKEHAVYHLDISMPKTESFLESSNFKPLTFG